MKILFLCGSLEPGKDGVGDYTRRLSGELIRQGHSASIIALNDRHINAVIQTKQESDGTDISLLRLPSRLSNKERYEEAGKLIADFNPEWLSLQYVPYSFQKRGLPFGLAKQLKRIGKGRKWHIMFHELWVGMDKNDTIQLKTAGNLQRYIIKTIIKTIKPAIIHTNTKLYFNQLRILNISAKLLPLFGNIPVVFEKSKHDNSTVIFIVFGGIHFGADIFEFSEWLCQLQQTENKKVIVYFVGKNGNELSVWADGLKNQNIEYKIFGVQDELNISQLISQSDIGITTTPYLLTEKSGSVAAMREHQLPVICVAREWTPRNIDFTFMHSVMEWKPNLSLENILKQKIESFSLQKITKQFINEIIN
jgi:hypothetical protein